MANEPNSIRLPYKLLQGGSAPIVLVRLFRAAMQTEDYALIDSGATYSIFDVSIANRLGIDFKMGR